MKKKKGKVDIGFFRSTRLKDRNKENIHTKHTTHTHTKAKEIYIYINTTMVNPHHSDSLFSVIFQ